MKVYLCVTLYHVYITLVKIISNRESKDDVVILLNANNEQIFEQFKYIDKQLKSNGYACDLRLRSKKNEVLGIERMNNRKQLKLVQDLMRKKGHSGFTLYNFAWNNSYIYSTASLLYKKCDRAVFMEESALIAKLPPEKSWKKMLHRIMGDRVDFYKDDKLSEIRVQRPETFPKEWKKKFTILDLPGMIQKTEAKDKDAILRIMSKDGGKLMNLLNEPDVGIVYTNPFSEQNLVSEQEKVEYILKMCRYYKKYGKVVVKLHPRDTTDYPLDRDISVLPASFPSELLALTGYRFKFAVAICSSAVNTTNAEYKVNMNENFLKDRKFVLKNINGEIVEE